MFNPFERPAEAILAGGLLQNELTVSFTPYEIKTYRFYDGKAEETDITEKPLG